MITTNEILTNQSMTRKSSDILKHLALKTAGVCLSIIAITHKATWLLKFSDRASIPVDIGIVTRVHSFTANLGGVFFFYKKHKNKKLVENREQLGLFSNTIQKKRRFTCKAYDQTG